MTSAVDANGSLRLIVKAFSFVYETSVPISSMTTAPSSWVTANYSLSATQTVRLRRSWIRRSPIVASTYKQHEPDRNPKPVGDIQHISNIALLYGRAQLPGNNITRVAASFVTQP